MAIIKYKNHTSIRAIESRMVELNNPILSFDFICCEEIDKLKIKTWKCIKKASQNTDVPIQIIEEKKILFHVFT